MDGEGQAQMFSFRMIKAPLPGRGARLGRLTTAGSSVPIDTPSFLAPSSRGVVPHLSHDNLREHTAIRGVYLALEDFIERGVAQAPVLAHPGPLRAFTGQPSGSLVVLAPRRSPPVSAPATNTDHSITVLTSTGFRELEATDYAASVAHLRPDAAVGMADVPAQRAGKNRAPKMAHRTELWLAALLSRAAGAVPVLAPVLPVTPEVQRLYFQTLEERVAEIAGLVFYDSSMAAGSEEEGIPATLDGLLKVTVDEIKNPHRLLQAVGWGADLVTLVLPTEATDAGIALAFGFPGELEEQEQQQQQQQARRRLGWDLWSEPQMATDTGPLMDGCSCYACRRHHRAYVSHLLAAKEMTAWVLLQIHNVHVVDRFLAGARLSIGRGTFERDVVRFAQQYEAELPAKTGEGPRLRGYQFRSTAGPRRNPKAFGKLGGDQPEELGEADSLLESGFAD